MTSDPHQADLSGWIAAAKILTADLDRCTNELMVGVQAGAIEQFWARAAVRAFFAYVEGSTFEMRRTLLKAHEEGAFSLPLADQALLSELTFDLDESGKPQSRPKFLQIERNVRFVFALFARAAHSNYKLDVAGQGWQSFLATAKVRNRIVHPREPEALDLTNAEVEAAARAMSWYSEQLRSFFATVPGPSGSWPTIGG